MNPHNTNQIAEPLPKLEPDSTINITSQLGHVPSTFLDTGKTSNSKGVINISRYFKIIGIFLLLFIIILTILVSYLYLKSNKKEESKSNTKEESLQNLSILDSTQWETYSHFEYDFEFKYPNELLFKGLNKDDIILELPSGKANMRIQSVNKYEKTRYESIVNFLEDRMKGDSPFQVINSESFSLNSNILERYSFYDNFEKKVYTFIFEDDLNSYIFSVNEDEFIEDFNLDDSNELLIFNSIVSTIKFNISEDTTDYKQYSDELIQFEYPKNWSVEVLEDKTIKIEHLGQFQSDSDNIEDMAQIIIAFEGDLSAVGDYENGRFAYHSIKRYKIESSSTGYTQVLVPFEPETQPHLVVKVAKYSPEVDTLELIDSNREIYTIKEYQDQILGIVETIRFPKDEEVDISINVNTIVDPNICNIENESIKDLANVFVSEYEKNSETLSDLFVDKEGLISSNYYKNKSNTSGNILKITSFSSKTSNDACIVNLVESNTDIVGEGIKRKLSLIIVKKENEWKIQDFSQNSYKQNPAKYSGFQIIL